jgi:hypothetical protein
MPGYLDPGFDTLALHAGATPDPTTGARAVPIHLSTSFVFESSDQAASLFNLERAGHVYSRISNPTNAVLEQRISALEGGIGADLGRNGFQALDRGQSLQGFVHAHPVRKRGAECGLDAGIFDFRLVAPRVVGIAGDEFPERAFLRGQVGAHALHNLLGCFGRRLSGALAQFFEICPRGIGVRGGEDGGGQEQGEQEDFHGAVGFGRRMVTIIGR